MGSFFREFIMNKKYQKIIEAVLIAAGLYLIFLLFNLITDPPYIILAIALVFVLYCIWVFPVADRRLSGDKKPEKTDQKDKKFYRTRNWDLMLFLSITLITFVVVHFFVLYMHEFSHSFAAYFLGAKENPLDIVWGRGIFGVHCDENVDYQTLFAAGKGTKAAAIAFAGPFSNILLFFVTAGLLLLKAVRARKWIYHTIFWVSGITFIMIFEYVFTRSFMTGDDFGNIEHGLGLSPYAVFIPGMILGLIGLWYILTVLLPGHYHIVAPGDISKQYITIMVISFAFFLLYIGVHILAYPSVPEWWTGCVGIAALFILPLLASPRRKWVRKKTG